MPLRDPVRSFTDAVSEACGAAVELTRPSDERHGDYATNVALQLAGTLRRPPREVAEELRERVARLDGVAGVEVAGPGFLNLTVDDRWLAGEREQPRDRVAVGAVPARGNGDRAGRVGGDELHLDALGLVRNGAAEAAALLEHRC